MSSAKKASSHPSGEILREDYMVPLGLSMNKLALALRVPVPRIAEIVHGRRSIKPDTALRLARYFNTSARFGSTCRQRTIWKRLKTHGPARSRNRCSR